MGLRIQTRTDDNARRLGIALALLVALQLLAPLADAQTTLAHDFSLFGRPYPLTRFVNDPWTDGVWIATETGAYLRTPDAVGMRQVSVREGLPANVVHDVAVGANAVFFATTHGVGVLSRSTGAFDHIKSEDGSRLVASTRTVRIWGDEVWLATDAQGLFRASLSTLVARPVPNPVNGSRFTDPVYDVWIRGQQAYISVSAYGLVAWNMTSGESDLHTMNLLAPKPIYYRLVVDDTFVYVATGGDGLVVMRRATGQMYEYANPNNTNSPVITNLALQGSELWMSGPGGVTRYDARAVTWKNWQNLPGGGAHDVGVYRGETYALTNAGYLVKYDRADDAWKLADWWSLNHAPARNNIHDCDRVGTRLLFSTGGGGANFYDPQTMRWTAAGYEPGDTDRPIGVLVWSSATDAREHWFGTHRGLTVHRLDDGSWSHFRTDGRDPRVNMQLPVYDVQLTPSDVWAGTVSVEPGSTNQQTWQRGNLARMDRATHTWTYYNRADGLADDNITVAQPDGDRVWIGTATRGLDMFSLGDNSIRHVMPLDGYMRINEVLPDGDTVWVGTGLGLYELSKTTMTARKVDAFGDKSILSLARHDGGLWVGTYADALYHYDPASAKVQSFPLGGIVSMFVNCIVVHDEVLYAGTTWGVHRFDLLAKRWLPQVSARTASQESVPEPTSATIKIDSPSSDASFEVGSRIDLAGAATGPAGAHVEARVGQGEWASMSGVQEWKGSLDVGTLPPGTWPLTARLRLDGATLVQASVPIEVTWPASSGSGASQGGTRFYHDPVREAIEGETVTFVLVSDPPVANVEASVEIVHGDVTSVLPLTSSAPGYWSVDYEANEPGSMAYAIRIRTGGEELSLPSQGDNYGERYSFVVRKGDIVLDFATVQDSYPAAQGAPSRIVLNVRNVLTHDAHLALRYGGTAGSWVQAASRMPLQPNMVEGLSLNVTPPKSAKAGVYELTISGTVEEFPEVSAEHSVKIVVGAAGQLAGKPAAAGGATDPGTGPIPGLGGIAAILVVALAVAVKRRRS